MKNINGAQKTRIVVALLSAIFILSMVSPAILANAYTWPSKPTVSYVVGSEDTTTGGNWVGTYGKYAYILPNPPQNLLEVPIGCFCLPCGGSSALANSPYFWTSSQISGLTYVRHNSPYWDEYYSQTPAVTYSITGTRTNTVQYPAFEWAWNSFENPATDPREAYYPTQSAYRLACWDDGGERGTPTHGYFDFHLTFPKGTYSLTVYAYDKEGAGRLSELFRIYDSTGTNLLASKELSQPAFTAGAYETFKVTVTSTSATIILQVYNDAGNLGGINGNGLPTVNVLLSGIFVNKI